MVYFGESVDLRRRFGRYSNPGPTQQTNIRMRDVIQRTLRNRGRCVVSVVKVEEFSTHLRRADLDLRLKAARVLIESSAIVIARHEGKRMVPLNKERGPRPCDRT